MENKLSFRDLTKDEIDCRVQSSGDMKDGTLWARLLLYKDARVDMALLDETVGCQNWQRKHEEMKGNIYCSVGINVNYIDPNKEPQWVWKQDCGTESNTEKEKGEASDSFKRACVLWGSGRELYTKIPITVFGLPKNYKGQVDGTFEVEAIRIENKEITGLSILFIKGRQKQRCFAWNKEKGILQCQVKDFGKEVDDKVGNVEV